MTILPFTLFCLFVVAYGESNYEAYDGSPTNTEQYKPYPIKPYRYKRPYPHAKYPKPYDHYSYRPTYKPQKKIKPIPIPVPIPISSRNRPVNIAVQVSNIQKGVMKKTKNPPPALPKPAPPTPAASQFPSPPLTGPYPPMKPHLDDHKPIIMILPVFGFPFPSLPSKPMASPYNLSAMPSKLALSMPFPGMNNPSSPTSMPGPLNQLSSFMQNFLSPMQFGTPQSAPGALAAPPGQANLPSLLSPQSLTQMISPTSQSTSQQVNPVQLFSSLLTGSPQALAQGAGTLPQATPLPNPSQAGVPSPSGPRVSAVSPDFREFLDVMKSLSQLFKS